MVGLVSRLLLLCAVVFGVVYGVTRALRQHAHSKEANRILEEIRALRAGLEAGLFQQEEYVRLVQQLKADCERQGLQFPALPSELPQPGHERSQDGRSAQSTSVSKD